ncbi:hypothetical protein J2Z37_003608 [Ammoniphilus resinae]|uniref:Carboxymuconolactone decarboxylase-like domain-containing protein n=2 Tax=Ammoniphilus resinae TaxID=861532 RepID=A0ABS4GUQ1_9BACL|nr:hypothetical protein [Ammoniphilus resinae]
MNMPILPPLSDSEVSEELRTIFEKSKRGSGSDNMVRTYAHNPELLQSFLQFYGGVWKGSIDPKLKEMVRYRVALDGQCMY